MTQSEASRTPEVPDEMLQLVMESFQGRHRRITLFSFLKVAAGLAIMVFAFVAFFDAATVRAQIGWATAFLVGCLGSMQWWLFYWLQVNRNAELREIKRLEVQVAELAERLDAKAPSV